MAPDVGEEQLQAVARAARPGARLEVEHLGRLLLLLLGGDGLARLDLAELEPEPLQLVLQLLELGVRQLVLERHRFEHGCLHEAPLLGCLHKGSYVLRFQQLLQLVLRQEALRPFSAASA